MPEEEEETKVWRYNLWENMISNATYVQNLLNVFEERNDIGLLCPPEPIGEAMRSWYYSEWADCFEETKAIAKQLKLEADISVAKPPISLSTVFWCRTSALRKLMDYPWKYTDLPGEPVPKSGTISHGIERVLAYVAQDAGYKTAMVMTDEYAAVLISYAQHHLYGIFQTLSELWHIGNLEQLRKMSEQRDKIIKYFTTHNDVYLYGAGVVGRRVLNFLKCYDCRPKGFLVSESSTQKEFESIPVFRLREIEKDAGIIVTVSKKFQDEIFRKLKTNDINDFIIFDC